MGYGDKLIESLIDYFGIKDRLQMSIDASAERLQEMFNDLDVGDSILTASAYAQLTRGTEQAEDLTISDLLEFRSENEDLFTKVDEKTDAPEYEVSTYDELSNALQDKDGKLESSESLTIRVDSNIDSGFEESGPLTYNLDADLTIMGTDDYTLDAGKFSRIFEFDAAYHKITIDNLTLTGGEHEDGLPGGAIWARASEVDVEEVAFSDNTTNLALRGNDEVNDFNGTAGDDHFVVVGDLSGASKTSEPEHTALLGQQLTSLVGEDFNEDADGGAQVIHGQGGSNTLHVYGEADISNFDLADLNVLEINSDVTAAASDLESMDSIRGDGGSILRIVSGDETEVGLDDLSGVVRLDVEEGVSVTLDSLSDVLSLSGEGTVKASEGALDLREDMVVERGLSLSDADGADADRSLVTGVDEIIDSDTKSDIIEGGPQDDYLVGNTNDQTFLPGGGDNIIEGGGGQNIYRLEEGSTNQIYASPSDDILDLSLISDGVTFDLREGTTGEAEPVGITLVTGSDAVGRGGLDVHLTQDLSGSYSSDVDNLRSHVEIGGDTPSLMEQLLEENPNTYFGLSGFVDKPTQACFPSVGFGGSDDYEFEEKLDITDNIYRFEEAVFDDELMQIRSGADGLESQLSAMQQIGLRGNPYDETYENTIGFRPGAAKVMLMATDIGFHEFSDLNDALPDIEIPPNDGTTTLQPWPGEPSITEVEVSDPADVGYFSITIGSEEFNADAEPVHAATDYESLATEVHEQFQAIDENVSVTHEDDKLVITDDLGRGIDEYSLTVNDIDGVTDAEADADEKEEGTPAGPPGTGEDYPTWEQIKEALNGADIYPIILLSDRASSSYEEDYEELLDYIGRGSIVGLDGTTADLADVILEALDEYDYPAIETVVGTLGDDNLTGNTLDNILWGNEGDNTLFGYRGTNVLLGSQEGMDTVQLEGEFETYEYTAVKLTEFPDTEDVQEKLDFELDGGTGLEYGYKFASDEFGTHYLAPTIDQLYFTESEETVDMRELIEPEISEQNIITSGEVGAEVQIEATVAHTGSEDEVTFRLLQGETEETATVSLDSSDSGLEIVTFSFEDTSDFDPGALTAEITLGEETAEKTFGLYEDELDRDFEWQWADPDKAPFDMIGQVVVDHDGLKEGYYGTGTGFLISPKHLMTNAHVITDNDDWSSDLSELNAVDFFLGRNGADLFEEEDGNQYQGMHAHLEKDEWGDEWPDTDMAIVTLDREVSDLSDQDHFDWFWNSRDFDSDMQDESVYLSGYPTEDIKQGPGTFQWTAQGNIEDYISGYDGYGEESGGLQLSESMSATGGASGSPIIYQNDDAFHFAGAYTGHQGGDPVAATLDPAAYDWALSVVQEDGYLTDMDFIDGSWSAEDMGPDKALPETDTDMPRSIEGVVPAGIEVQGVASYQASDLDMAV